MLLWHQYQGTLNDVQSIGISEVKVYFNLSLVLIWILPTKQMCFHCLVIHQGVCFQMPGLLKLDANHVRMFKPWQSWSFSVSLLIWMGLFSDTNIRAAFMRPTFACCWELLYPYIITRTIMCLMLPYVSASLMMVYAIPAHSRKLRKRPPNEQKEQLPFVSLLVPHRQSSGQV